MSSRVIVWLDNACDNFHLRDRLLQRASGRSLEVDHHLRAFVP
jgi:hypothetical protein